MSTNPAQTRLLEGRKYQPPPLPDSLNGYFDLFRTYWRKLQEVNVRRSRAIDVALSSPAGFPFLFLLCHANVGYLAMMTAAYYYHERDEYFTRPRLLKLMRYSPQHVSRALSQAFLEGHILKMSRTRYQMTPPGVAWLKGQVKQYYRDIQALLDEENPLLHG